MWNECTFLHEVYFTIPAFTNRPEWEAEQISNMDCVGVRTHIEQRTGECNEIKVIHHAKNDRDISWHSTRKRNCHVLSINPHLHQSVFSSLNNFPLNLLLNFYSQIGDSLRVCASQTLHLGPASEARACRSKRRNRATWTCFSCGRPGCLPKKKNSALTQKKLAIFGEKKCHKLNMLPITY